MASTKTPKPQTSREMGASGNPTGIHRSQNAEELALRRHEALKLRLEGKTLVEIAQQVGVSRVTVSADLDVAMSQVVDETLIPRLRQIENLRLDRALYAAFEVLNGSDGELKLKAVDRILRVSSRRSALNGLDAPVELNVRTTEKTQQDLELEELVREAQARNQAVHDEILSMQAGSDSNPAAAA